MVNIEEFHRRAVGFFRKANVEHPEEARHGHPKIVADNKKGMNPGTVTLAKRTNQFGVFGKSFA